MVDFIVRRRSARGGRKTQEQEARKKAVAEEAKRRAEAEQATLDGEQPSGEWTPPEQWTTLLGHRIRALTVGDVLYGCYWYAKRKAWKDLAHLVGAAGEAGAIDYYAPGRITCWTMSNAEKRFFTKHPARRPPPNEWGLVSLDRDALLNCKEASDLLAFQVQYYFMFILDDAEFEGARHVAQKANPEMWGEDSPFPDWDWHSDSDNQERSAYGKSFAKIRAKIIKRFSRSVDTWKPIADRVEMFATSTWAV